MTIRNALKELIRTPGKTFFFLLLLALSAAMLTVGANLYGNNAAARKEVEGRYRTVGTIRQMPDGTSTVGITDIFTGTVNLTDSPEYTTVIPEDAFAGLPAKLPVENRPSVVTTGVRADGETLQSRLSVQRSFVYTFIPNEDVDSTDEAFLDVHKRAGSDFYFSAVILTENGEKMDPLQNRRDVYLPWGTSSAYTVRLKKGVEYAALGVPSYDAAGNKRIDLVSAFQSQKAGKTYLEYESFRQIAFENTPEFAESEEGKALFSYIDVSRQTAEEFPLGGILTVPTASLSLLDPFYAGNVTMKSGREITEEEFQSGARVCLVPESLATDPLGSPEENYSNYLEAGDKITLNWRGAIYGTAPYTIAPTYGYFNVSYMEDIPKSEPVEYEIVGVYATNSVGYGGSELNLGNYEIIVPSASYDFDSVPILYGGPLQPGCCSFELENGGGEAFMNAFRQLGFDTLQVEISDQGYTVIAKGLDAVSLVALILLLAGGISSLCLLLFFVYLQIARRKREAAIRASLGAGKRRCAAGLLCGVMLVAILGVCAGTLGGHLVSSQVSQKVYEQAASSGYSRDYSDQFETSQDLEFAFDTAASLGLSLGAGGVSLAVALVLALGFTFQALKPEPLELLTQKEQ